MQNLFPQKNSFGKTESAFRPAALPRNFTGRTPPERKTPFPFLEKIHPRENQKSKRHFFFLGLPSEARWWRDFRGAYDLGQSHHALGACDIICFENKCELGTIETQEQNLTAFSKPEGGTRFARPIKKLVFCLKLGFLSRWSGLNRRPTVYKTVALPTELHRQ